jgi:hypothetical protein
MMFKARDSINEGISLSDWQSERSGHPDLVGTGHLRSIGFLS